jgi:hypothetical protein
VELEPGLLRAGAERVVRERHHVRFDRAHARYVHRDRGQPVHRLGGVGVLPRVAALVDVEEIHDRTDDRWLRKWTLAT